MNFADDFNQLYQVYQQEDGIIVSKNPSSLYRFDDFDFDQFDIEDFYFSVPRLLNYR